VTSYYNVTVTSKLIEEYIEIVKGAIGRGDLPSTFKGFERKLCEGAVRGLDITQFTSYNEWISWLSWASVSLDENDYLKAAIHGLRLAPRLAATDYGTSRKRDLGQRWTDAIRGFLGEIAFTKWMQEKFGFSVKMDYGYGPLSEFLMSDVKSIDGREPRLKIGIKTTKLEGVWLDIPGAQIKHSDVFVLVRVGVTSEHFVAFLKKISAIRDKLMKEALGRGLVREEELKEAWDVTPEFTPVPAYIVGFLNKLEYMNMLKDDYSIIEADGEVKRVRVVINKYIGFWNPDKEKEYRTMLLAFLRNKGKNIRDGMKITFEGIGDFSKTLHFIANSGSLRRREDEWKELLREL